MTVLGRLGTAVTLGLGALLTLTGFVMAFLWINVLVNFGEPRALSNALGGTLVFVTVFALTVVAEKVTG